MSNPLPAPIPVQTHNVDWISRILAIFAIMIGTYQVWYTHNVPPSPVPNPNPAPSPSPTPTPGPAPTVDLVSVGRSYAAQGISSTWGSEMIAAGNAVKNGTDLATAQANMQAAWDKDRTAAFQSDHHTLSVRYLGWWI